ncbi:DUF3953 domain-containing protein [Bacillus manliponensis]|uniref:DUF3953 domain-containing protein n=1 Tax=Bacillus manliponensis TaxID=574376 RepID=UPI00351371EE
MTLKISRIILSFVLICVASYGLFTRSELFLSLTQVLSGLFMLVIGIEQMKEKKKATGLTCITACLFVWGVQAYVYFS